ncbi:MAG TPA: hypothetical protein VFB38_08800 [Chthonomonadaceae bacterium]|nr:hypothetical protein [Chthonomonadaceae bacterium]
MIAFTSFLTARKPARPSRNRIERGLLLLMLCLLPVAGFTQGRRLIPNGGFEGGGSGRVPGWEAYEGGFEADRQAHHGGAQSIRCTSRSAQARLGALARTTLNQTRPIPVLVTGWSKAEGVSGVKDSDYSIYVDLEYTDGTPLWGQIAPFNVGTHDWERRQVLVLPAKPIRTMSVYALFRNHSGTAWFDDFAAQEMAGDRIFDSQALSSLPPHPAHLPPDGAQMRRVTAGDGLALDINARGEVVAVRAGGQSLTSPAAGGFFVRDVAAEGPLAPLRGAVTAAGRGVQITGESGPARLRFQARVEPQGDALAVEGTLTDLAGTDRAVTVYLALPIQADGWQWGQDIRHAETIQPGREYSNQAHVNVGATGGLSLYPFACIAGPRNGVGIANQIGWPSVYRLFYNGTTRQFVIAWDFALTDKVAAWPRTAHFRGTLFRLPPGQAEWGFRAAAQRFYRLNAQGFERRAKADGIWMPFTDPSTVQHFEDFGFAYHEGDNSIRSDDTHGILSFRYTEPMSYWMPMPPAWPRTYENAIALLHKNADGNNAEARDFSRATLNSGTWDEHGRFNLEFQNQPWANGAVFTLDPNPQLPATSEHPTKASISYTQAKADQMYGPAARRQRGDQDGEYLDSLEGWADTQDYRPSNLAACPCPLPFDTDSRRPVLPQWYSTHAFARFLSADLHRRGKLLMANTTPVRFSIYASLMDVMGIEVNWLDAEGRWRPDSDAVFNLRRTMSAQKPYLLLMNTNYDRFTPPLVEKYFQRSMFYGVFPSMFSADAATHPYWEAPKWYNRDRPLFKKYIPIVKRLSAAGWEPITHAHSANPAVYVERFGSRLFTLLNDSDRPQETVLTIDLDALRLQASGLRVVTLLTNADIPARQEGTTLSIPLHLAAEEALALELK